MTRDEKLQFIRDLTATVIFDIIAKVDEMPDEWDGIELRRYIADKFEEQVVGSRRGEVRGYSRDKRLAAYRNECIVRNL